MPSEVSIAITCSSRPPVSALVADVGLQASPAGWEIYVGGHAEHPVKEGSLLGTTESEQQAFILTSACLQWYRQTAWFDEPLWMWMERLGIMIIRETLLDTRLQREITFNLIQEREADAERGKESFLKCPMLE